MSAHLRPPLLALATALALLFAVGDGRATGVEGSGQVAPPASPGEPSSMAPTDASSTGDGPTVLRKPYGGGWDEPIPPTEPSHWGYRSGVRWEASVGGVVGLLDGRDALGARESAGFYGGTLSFGLHHVGTYYRATVFATNTSWEALCAPVLCLGAFFVMPTSAFLGNERGIDLRGRLARDLGVFDGWRASLGVRPIFRVARESRLRTASFIGAIAPELGLEWGAHRAINVYLGWSPYPIGLWLAQHLALEWDTVELAPHVALDGTGVFLRVGTSITVVVL